MNTEQLQAVELKKCNEKILKSFWTFTLIALIVELVIYIHYITIDKNSDLNFVLKHILLPTAVNITVVFFTQQMFKIVGKYKRELEKYLMVISGTVIVLNLIFCHGNVITIYVLFLFPIFLSGIYFKPRLTIFALFINLVSYILVYLFFPLAKQKLDFNNFYSITACIIVAYVITNSLMRRGYDLLQSLQESMRTKEDLLVRTILMEKTSKIEPTTGLYNHITFHEYLDELIYQSESYSFSLQLALLDLDNFKRINDIYGHRVGDMVIKALANLIQSRIGADDFAARYGGEEFAIIFTDHTLKEVHQVVESIRQELLCLTISELKNERITVSIGLHQYAKRRGKKWFFEGADKALYIAKRRGKNQTIIYDETTADLTYVNSYR